MKKIVFTLSALALLIGAAARDTDYKPQYGADGKLLIPSGYRQWQYVSSGVGMSYNAPTATPPRSPGFSNIFVQPWAYREYKATGKWPEKTMFVLEAYSSATNAAPNRQGYFQDSFAALEAEVKDSSHSPDVWSYYNFGTGPGPAAAFAKNQCWQCHEDHAAVEHSFTQFYPELLEVALAKQTLKAGIYIPPNVKRIRELIVSSGWPAAEQALAQAKEKAPDAAIFTEAALNGLGYQLIGAKHPAEAVKVMQRVTRDYPSSLNALDSLADAYDAAGDKQLAVETSKTLIARAEKETPQTPLIAALKKSAEDRIARLEKE